MKKLEKYNREFLEKLEKMLRGDPLLRPHFENGDIHILGIDKAGDDPIWIDFTLKEDIQKFIKSQVNAILFGMRDQLQEQSIRDWDERVEMIRVLEADEELWPYFESEKISWTNYPDKAVFEIEFFLPSAEIFFILRRTMDVVEEKFDSPESGW